MEEVVTGMTRISNDLSYSLPGPDWYRSRRDGRVKPMTFPADQIIHCSQNYLGWGGSKPDGERWAEERLNDGFEGWLEVQPLGWREKSEGESTQPCGAAVLMALRAAFSAARSSSCLAGSQWSAWGWTLTSFAGIACCGEELRRWLWLRSRSPQIGSRCRRRWGAGARVPFWMLHLPLP